MDAPGIPDGPISLPTGATLVSDADEEIFLLYTRLASLKPPDSSDMGHFHGLGSENSKEDALLVRIELQSPPPPPPSTATTDELSPAPRYEKRNAGRRNTGKKKREAPSGSSGRQDLGPVVLEFFISLSSIPSSIPRVQKPTLINYDDFSIEFLSVVLRQLHFPEPTRRNLFDYTKLRQAHILELGCVPSLN